MKKIPFAIVLALIASCKSYDNSQISNNDEDNRSRQSDTVSISSDECDYNYCNRTRFLIIG
jgi:hypothetical protein